MPAHPSAGHGHPAEIRPGETTPGGAAHDTILAKLRQARARMAEVRQALSSASTPEEIGACLPLLEEAIACLRAIAPVPAPPNALKLSGPELAGEIAAVRFESGIVRRVLEGGAQFYQGWARILAGAVAGYMPTGEPAALTAPGSVSIEG